MQRTAVVLDPGAGPRFNDHGDDVLVPSTCSKRQDVFTWEFGEKKRNVSNFSTIRTISQTFLQWGISYRSK